ncbi:hypothetical protein [Blastococcus sp. SYSU DS0973]
MTAEPVPSTADATRATTHAAEEPPAARSAPFGRRTAIVCLTVGATLNLVEAITGRLVGGNESVAAWFDAWAAHPTLATVGLTAGTLAVPFLLLGFVAMAQLIRPRMPRLGTTVAFLCYIGGLGFYGMHGLMVMQYVALDHPDRAAMVSLVEQVQSSPMSILVLLPFLIGIPLGVLLAGVGFFRTRAVPRWVAAALILFIVVDFSPISTGPVDPHWLFLAASLGVAFTVARMSDREWWTGRTTERATR